MRLNIKSDIKVRTGNKVFDVVAFLLIIFGLLFGGAWLLVSVFNAGLGTILGITITYWQMVWTMVFTILYKFFA